MLIPRLIDNLLAKDNYRNISEAKKIHQRAVKEYNSAKKKYEREITNVQRRMDRVETLRMDIGFAFNDFSALFEQIKNKPQFGELRQEVGYINNLELEDMHANYYYKQYLTQFAASYFLGPLSGILLSDWSEDLIDDAQDFAEEVGEEIDKINKGIEFLTALSDVTSRYENSLLNVKTQYNIHLSQLRNIVEIQRKTDYLTYTPSEKKLLENTVLLTGLLNEMCKVQLCQRNANSVRDVNNQEVDNAIQKADTVLNRVQNN